MFRRSRFSIRPNVGATGKTASTPQESPSASQETSETPNDVGESSTATAVTDNKPAVTPSETPTVPGDGIDQHVEGTSSSAALQRRKRFSIKPKVAPGRPSIAARKTRIPVKSASETPVSDHDKPNTSSQTGTASAPQRLQSPRRRRPSEESKQQIIQPKPTTILSEPSVVPTAEDSTENKSLLANTGKEFENISASQGNEASFSLPDKVPLSLPDKEAIAISEKARTLMSSKSRLSLSTPAFSLSRLLNDPSDLQRLAKAQKLRDLLREEMHKEKKTKRSKKREKEFDLDPAKMTMRDLIRYLPQSNPMTRTKCPRESAGTRVRPKNAKPVKVAEDGTLIIDEESLTVEVQRAKGPNPANERDPIFERGSTTTYSSFRKGTYCKPWSSEETDMFFLAISMVGTDFSMICQLFPLRARSEIKNKFKKEERENSWRIDKAFRERRKLDIEYFSKLLEKIMEVQKNRKKLKAMAEKKPPKERKKREKGQKKAGKKLNEAFIPGDKEPALPEDCQKSDLSEKTEGAKDGTIKPAKLSRGRAPKPLLPLGRKMLKKPPPPSTKTNDDASDKGEESVIDGVSTEQRRKQPFNLQNLPEVEETMEELDILATMPDVLGISQNALCPDDSCEWAQKETGTAEPCEHQLDLLVDVIDFLSIDHAEVSEDESYNEAAQTLLTIGNLAHLSQSAQNQIAIEDQLTGTTSDGVNETSEQLEEEVATKIDAEKENRATPVMSATSVNEVTETSETVTTVELQNIIDNNDIPILESSDQRTGSDVDPTSQLTSKTDSPPTRRARLSKVKPKPNLGQASRTAQSKSQPATSTVRAAEESPSDAPDLSQAPCPSPALDMKPSVDLASTPTLTEELSGVSGATTSQRRASENKDISEAQFEIRREPDMRDTRPTDEDMMSHVGTSEMSCNNPLTSDTVVAEMQIGQGSNGDYPASCVKPLEELPVSEKEKEELSGISGATTSQQSASENLNLSEAQFESRRELDTRDLPVGEKEGSEVKSTSQARKSRFQKIKPNLNLAQTSRTVRSKAQTSKDNVEKDSDLTPTTRFHEKTIAEVAAEPTCTASPSEKPSHSPGPSSDCIPSLDFGITLKPTEELSTTEEKETDLEVVSGSTTTQQSASETQNLSEAQFESSRGQETRDTKPASESTEESASSVTPVIELPVSQKEASEVKSSSLMINGQSQQTLPLEKLPRLVEADLLNPNPPWDAADGLHNTSRIHNKQKQDASTSSAGGTQGHPSLTIFPDMMLPQDPSDPDEPFFILSLTEIPVSSSREGVDSVPEPLPALPVTDAPIEQQSVPGESLATAEEQPSPNVTVPVPMEDSNETGVIHVKDPDDGSTEGNQVDPHETAKPQVKPKMTKRKQTSKTAAAKKAESLPIQTDTTEQLELPGPSVQPEASDDTEPQRGRADHVEVEKETLTDVVDPEGTSSGAKTTRTSSRNRKAKDSDPGKAASKSPKVKTPRAKGKKSTPAAVASTPCEVTPKPGPKPGQHASEHSRPRSEQTPSTSLCPAEGSTSQPSEYMESSSLEEEPTNVSQYFLSDISTDAESLPIQTDTTEQLELPGPSVQPEASDDTEPQRGRADHVEVEKETLTDVVDPEGTSSGAKTTRTSSRNRKAKDSDPGKAASKSAKVKTPRAKGKKTTPAAVASTPCEVTPKPCPKPGQHASEHSRPRSEQTPSTSLCPAECSTSQPSEYMESSSLEEEPTSVSQYFLSDIFTDAEEG
ncbi:hypothetical protein JOQ06_008061 [Pogonophryne albipinna]|uniref:Myb-like domain-containing protein n=1 Tax=Pogonophryne albipinna TaxID=1090488 RepID=A0AAD6F9P6_9TELE|nr:hypothetical protein JOQ06_008061 [Pogonophryne albipinna]